MTTKAADCTVDELRAYIYDLNGRFQIHRAFFKLAPMPAMIKDSLGRVVFMNKLAEELFGFKMPVMFGKTLVDHQIKSEVERTGKQDGQVLRSKAAGVFLNQFIDLEDRVVRYSCLKFPIFAENGDTFIGWMAVKSGSD
jgi:PAS domain-containing protein